MHVVVCLKPVPNAQDIRINPETKTLDRKDAQNVINPPDLNALELALQLKDKHGAKVTVLSMCPPFGEPFLRDCIAMGADDAILISDRAFAGSDTYPTSYTLAAGVRKINSLKAGEYKGNKAGAQPKDPYVLLDDKPVFGDVDLVICGEETTDSSTGQTGPGIAEWLRWPQVTYIKDLKVVDKDGKPVATKVEGSAEGLRIHCTQDLEGARSTWEAELPAVVTVNLGINTPRAPNLARSMLAKQRFQLTTYTSNDLDVDRTKLGLKGSPTVVGKILTIDLAGKKTEMLDGTPEEIAKKLVDRLEEKGLLKGVL